MKIPFYKSFTLNLRVSYRAFLVLVNPLNFAFFLIRPKEKKLLKLRTPIGKINVWLRNRQSARTIFSIFIREDYPTDMSNKNILDIGSNIGISAIYFLSRNKYNKILCFEPDPNNAYYLKKNLELFKERSEIYFYGVGANDSEDIEFNLSTDGKYSSFNEIPSYKLDKKVKVKVISLENALKKANFNDKYPTLIKIDIEGLEKKVLNNFDFTEKSNIKELIVEGLGNKEYINKKAIPRVINFYVEKFTFS